MATTPLIGKSIITKVTEVPPLQKSNVGKVLELNPVASPKLIDGKLVSGTNLPKYPTNSKLSNLANAGISQIATASKRTTEMQLGGGGGGGGSAPEEEAPSEDPIEETTQYNKKNLLIATAIAGFGLYFLLKFKK